MEHVISDSEAPRLFNTVLISAFAVIALLLAVLGIYGVIAFSVALREQEMAIRMALGCQRQGVLHLVLASAVKLGAIGCLLGLLAASGVSHLLRSSFLESVLSIHWCCCSLQSPCCRLRSQRLLFLRRAQRR